MPLKGSVRVPGFFSKGIYKGAFKGIRKDSILKGSCNGSF